MSESSGGSKQGGRRGGGLFRKYAIPFMAVVSLALIVSGVIQGYFSYHEKKTDLLAIQSEKASNAALQITQSLVETESYVRSSVPSRGVQLSLAERHTAFDRIVYHLEAVSSLSYVDASGREQLRVSNLPNVPSVLGREAPGGGIGPATPFPSSETGADRTAELAAANAANQPLSVNREQTLTFGALSFNDNSEPQISISFPDTPSTSGPTDLTLRNPAPVLVIVPGGVTIAEVNLKFLLDVVRRMNVGSGGEAFVIDSDGNLIADSDFNRVRQHVQVPAYVLKEAADGVAGSGQSRDLDGKAVLSAHQTISPVGWTVFVDEPASRGLRTSELPPDTFGPAPRRRSRGRRAGQPRPNAPDGNANSGSPGRRRADRRRHPGSAHRGPQR